ncbi:MAG: hypothetical protein ACR2RF_33150 [Geminicoccaceae bacterium]
MSVETDTPKRPEFSLGKKPEPDPTFTVVKGEDGKFSIEMNGVIVPGGKRLTYKTPTGV